MTIKPGTRLWSTVSSASVVVVRPPRGEVTLTCGGAPMTESAPKGTPDTASDEGPVIGKRYADEESGLQVMCTHGGSGALAADGRPLELLGARQLPASD